MNIFKLNSAIFKKSLKGNSGTIQFLVVAILLVFSSNVNSAHQPYSHTDPEYASSVYHLKLLFETELHLLPFIYSAYKNEIRTGSHVDMELYIRDFTSSNVTPLKSKVTLDQFVFLLNDTFINVENFVDDTVKHPLKSYTTIYRFVRYISQFKTITANKELMSALDKSMLQIKFPKQEDLDAAMQNILRLRQVFKFSFTDLIVGKIGKMKTKSGLNVIHLTEIADHATSLNMYTHAVDIYDGVIKHCGQNLADVFYHCSPLNTTDILHKLNKVINEHDKQVGINVNNFDWQSVPPDSSPFLFQGHLDSTDSPSFTKRKHVEISPDVESTLEQSPLPKYDKEMAISPFVYEKLCKGEFIKKANNKPAPKCHNIFHTHPTYTIGPLKTEVHNEDPQIVQFYDIISENEIKDLQKEVQRDMRQSRTATTSGDDVGQTSRYRTSANAWIVDTNPKYKYLFETITCISGLNLIDPTSTELLQIAAYNPGCHYTPHSDAIFEEEIIPRLNEVDLDAGDRIVTFMLYLSDVEKGGATVFPTLRTLVQPVKGSGVMWHNLNSDGTINYNLFHGGCPVLYGTKWIANKWIRSSDQMFVKKCPKGRQNWKVF